MTREWYQEQRRWLETFDEYIKNYHNNRGGNCERGADSGRTLEKFERLQKYRKKLSDQLDAESYRQYKLILKKHDTTRINQTEHRTDQDETVGSFGRTGSTLNGHQGQQRPGQRR